jgi:hypothetical protein
MLRDDEILVLDLEPQAIEDAHVDIRNPYQGKFGNHIAAPSEAQHFEVCQQQKQCRHIVAEAILASKQIEEFTQVERRTVFTLVFAEVSRLSKDLLMGDSPGYTCGRKAEKEQESELLTQGNGQEMVRHSSPFNSIQLPPHERELPLLR